MRNEGGQGIIYVKAYGDESWLCPSIKGLRYRGTEDSPLPTQTGDIVWELAGYAYDGASLQFINLIKMEVDDGGSSTGRIKFLTRGSGDTGPQLRMVIKSDGKVGIGTGYPDYLLHVRDGEVKVENESDAARIYLEGKDVGYGCGDIQFVNKTDAGTELIGRFLATGSYLGFISKKKFYVFTPNSSGSSAVRLEVRDGADEVDFLIKNSRVGIGTDSPQARLHVEGGEVWVFDDGNSPRLVLGDNGSEYGYLQWDSLNNYFRIEKSNDANGLKVNGNFVSIGNIYPGEPLIVGYGSTEIFKVKSSGEVEVIGTLKTDELDLDKTVESSAGSQAGYVRIKIGGTEYLVPVYNVS